MNRLNYVLNLAKLRHVNYESTRCIKRWVAPTQKEITRRKRRLPPQPEPKRSTFVEWNRGAEIYAFNQRLSEKFETEKLEQAFTHKSYIFEEERKQKEMGIDSKLEIEHNESLIEKGRELTSKVVEKYLIKSFPNVPESGIMAFYDYLLSQEILAKASLHIGTKDIILTAEHPVMEETLANTFFALVAALAESMDPNHASDFIRDFLIVALAEKDLTEIWYPTEPLAVLNDILCRQNREPVQPRIIAHAGRNTILSAYGIALYSNKEFLGSGFGQTIQEAKDVAVANTLYRIFGLLDSSPTIRFDRKIDIMSS